VRLDGGSAHAVAQKDTLHRQDIVGVERRATKGDAGPAYSMMPLP
jgi:hypothetical protein